MINSFRGEYDFLSNFYPSPIVYGFEVYPTVEHAFQASKCENMRDRERVRLASTPAAAKKLGRICTLRPDWEQVKLTLMARFVREKFLQHPDLLQKLLETKDEELVEGNHWGDTYWGVCGGVGENHLGLILMKLREGLCTQANQQQS